MAVLNRGKAIRWGLFGIAIYVSLALLDVVPLDRTIRDVIVAAGRVVLWAAVALVSLFLLYVIGDHLSRRQPWRQFERALYAGDRAKVEELFTKLSRHDCTLLLGVAAALGDHDLVRRLLAQRAGMIRGKTFPDDARPLLAAASNGNRQIVETLIAHGADVNFVGDGQTPLDVAVESHSWDVVQALLKHGARFTSGYEDRESARAEVESLLAKGEYIGACHAARGFDLPELDEAILALVPNLRANEDSGEAQLLCEAAMERLVTVSFPERLPLTVPVLLRTLAELREFHDYVEKALTYFRHAVGIWQRLRVPPSGPVRLFGGNDADPDPFSEASLQALVAQAGDDHEEIVALLRGCERILGRLSMTQEQMRVAAALKRLEEARQCDR